MRRLGGRFLDAGARVLYGVATAIDVCADWLAHRHKPRF